MDNVRYTRNTDFVYNGQKMLVPTGTLYTRFTVFIYSYIHTYINIFTIVKEDLGFIIVYISCSSQCFTTGITKVVVCAILSVGWCI